MGVLGLIFLGLAIAGAGALVIDYALAPRYRIVANALISDSRINSAPRSSEKIDVSIPERIHRSTFEQIKTSLVPSDEELLRAGLFSNSSKVQFRWINRALCITCTILGACTGFIFDVYGTVGLGLLGFAIGLRLPRVWIDHVIKKRGEEIMLYLPLVIEQIIIGISSSLDVAPCIQRVVAMADERDTHNPVTELLAQVGQLVQAGTRMEEALEEVGNLSGHTELKHAFMALGQVTTHGGEVTKQLQELADSVSLQREVRIEARIKRLELEAIGPVALVFISFISVLLTGIGIHMKHALK